MSELLKVHFEKAGIYTSVQDEGRFGVQYLGIPFGGALDKSAMHKANELVGNPISHPVLEMTMVGAKISFGGKGQIAITGAQMTPTLNGLQVGNFKTINVESGDELEFHNAINGCRTYMSIGGEWQTTEWQGSFSALSSLMSSVEMPCKLQNGDTFQVKTSDPVPVTEYPSAKRPIYSSCYIIRVVTGPEFGIFELRHIEEFFRQIFLIDPASNRMGYRLKGELPDYTPQREEISSGIVIGTVQITNAGKPIILMADAQTTGGYPRIANVLTDDLDTVAQMKPGDEVKFMLVSLEEG